ncbi:MAG: hypothetical protein IID44_27065 [Planctomycetes bacterium]|nr:hypothetical protein [Planctomycetota bacterium]
MNDEFRRPKGVSVAVCVKFVGGESSRYLNQGSIHHSLLVIGHSSSDVAPWRIMYKKQESGAGQGGMVVDLVNDK